MDIFFQDPTEVPLPPEEVRIKDLRIEPWADGRRVRIHLEVTPFQKRPNLEVVIRDSSGVTAAEVNVIETMARKLDFNMHLRQENPGGVYTLQVWLYYDPPLQDKEPASEETPERMVVDQRQAGFEIQL